MHRVPGALGAAPEATAHGPRGAAGAGPHGLRTLRLVSPPSSARRAMATSLARLDPRALADGVTGVGPFACRGTPGASRPGRPRRRAGGGGGRPDGCGRERVLTPFALGASRPGRLRRRAGGSDERPAGCREGGPSGLSDTSPGEHAFLGPRGSMGLRAPFWPSLPLLPGSWCTRRADVGRGRGDEGGGVGEGDGYFAGVVGAGVTLGAGAFGASRMRRPPRGSRSTNAWSAVT